MIRRLGNERFACGGSDEKEWNAVQRNILKEVFIGYENFLGVESDMQAGPGQLWDFKLR